MWSSCPANRLHPAAHPSAARCGQTVTMNIWIRSLPSEVPLRFVSAVNRSPFPTSCQLFKGQLITFSSLSRQDDNPDVSAISAPVIEAAAAATTASTEDATFLTAQGSSFFTKDAQADVSSFSYTSDSQNKESLAGSYCYTSAAATPPEFQAQGAGRSTPNGEILLCFARS